MRTVVCGIAAIGVLAASSCAVWRGLGDGDATPIRAQKMLRQDAEITAAKWTSPDADIVEILTEEPAECLSAARDAEDQYFVSVGRAAFNSPFLLGGQAARLRLTCNSCHRSGSDNPDFFIDGLSSVPGTADVTSSIFSDVREDHEFNPVAIPSLLDSASKSSFGSHGISPSLTSFIGAAVTNEFQGQVPPQPVLDGLVAYVSHLNSAACVGTDSERSLHRDVSNIAGIIGTAIESLKREEYETADILVLMAQNKFLDIYERYNIGGLFDERAVIADRAKQLATLRPAVAAGKQGAAIELAAFKISLEPFAKYLSRSSKHSLYNKDVLINYVAKDVTESLL